MTPKGLLCDYAGVLTDDMFDAMRRFCETHDLPPQRLAEAYTPGGAIHAAAVEFECGRLDIAEFEPLLGEGLGIADHEGLVDRLVGRHQLLLAHEVIEAVKAVRATGVRTCLFSNSWGFDLYDPEVRAAFDVEVLSGAVNARKPQPEIYPIALEVIGLAPEEVVFVDDQPVNLEPAQELGIDTIHHTDPATTVAELERRFGPLG
jgi:putative hydrolase of the HAD superfamily